MQAFEEAERMRIQTFAEKFYDLDLIADARANNSLQDLEDQATFALCELSEIQIKEDYRNPKMHLTIIKLYWFEILSNQ